MKILFVLDYFYPYLGGAETLFTALIDGLIKKGFEIWVVTSRFDQNLKEEEHVDNLHVIRVGKSRYDFITKAIPVCTKLAKEKQIDLIHATTYSAAIPAKIASLKSGKKTIITVHEIFGKIWYEFKPWTGFFYKLYEKLLFKLNFDKYVAVSFYVKNMIRTNFSVKDSKLITIHNGIDYGVFNSLALNPGKIQSIKNKYNLNNHFVGVFVGRPGKTKGLEFYLRSIPKIIKKIPNFKAFLILLESENEKKIKYILNLIDALSIKNYVKILYDVPYKKINNYMSVADFVIVPSISEGFGYVAVEASALQIPLVVSNVGSLPEVVSGKVVFAKAGNPESIYNAIIKLYNGNYQQIPFKEFNFEDTIAKYIDLYHKIL